MPADLKVLVVGGEPRLVELHTGRGGDHHVRLHSPEWEPLPWTIGFRPGPDTATCKEIAARLGISPHTVDQRVKAAMQTLGVGSRVARP